MNIINLPVERAVEPDEEARQPGVHNEGCHSGTFLETSSQVPPHNGVYKNLLSQPPKGITHKQKMVWLQHRRKAGLWAQCDDCDRWRYLPQTLDTHELSVKWYCWMNPDKSLATCSSPEVPICLYDEDDLIHAEYAAGSIVLARLPGFPWWPAMVCDCPDTEQYYWLDGFSDIPTHYNVVFFDSFDVSRAWMTPEQLKPYKNNIKLLKKALNIKKYKNRLEIATNQADDADKLSLSSRLAKYSFIARFPGNIVTPKKIKKKEIVRHQTILKRKFNIDFSDESPSPEKSYIKTEKINTKRKVNKQHERKEKSSSTVTDIGNSELTEAANENLNNTRDLNSLAVQVDKNSGLIKSIYSEVSNNDISQEVNTIRDLPACKGLLSQEDTNTVLTFNDNRTENSDDFEF